MHSAARPLPRASVPRRAPRSSRGGRAPPARHVAPAAASSSPSSSSSPAVVILPGLGNASGDYDAFASDLTSRGFHVTVAEVIRPDWLRNAAGLADAAYWRGTLAPRPTVDWYLDRIHSAIRSAKSDSGADRVALVAHSAGGWMARVYLDAYGVQDVRALVSLGSPLNAVPKGVPGVVDQTRGILTWVGENCATAADLGVPVTCLAGRWLEGRAELALAEGRFASGVSGFVVGQGYKQVCGDAGAWGDGITPVAAAHLDGAENVTLEGVFHTPLGSDDESRPWYGSPRVLDQWVDKLR